MATTSADRDDAAGAVLFDVDGTLMDTVYLHTVAWWEALRQHGHHVTMSRIHRLIGMGSDHLLDELLGEDRDRDGDGALSAAHDALYAQFWSRLAPLPGAADLLRACAERGWRVVLASSAKKNEADVMIRALGAGDAIDAVATADDVASSKPAPDLVQQALAKAGVPAGRAVFVGDAGWDARAARKAGVRCLGLLTGGWTREELRGSGAEEVYESTEELLERIEDSPLSAPGGDTD
ncbi:haloacid dehalogenase superfamily, subfamily IA, variant 3 with third motif having DD or ED/haloacid dehalogenase superfamily, subfamily IA, variant 1 with third motif having Dx(3-4)D or Dx(3-4)E [Actinacidiphila yanglinensis]|uniref:Haloacid dehalogenase superfamily, subfamily IA, variant 3 with third motif having DD or ED/haloacid dehalogenase superfamily, subfamily IA, variant 1 with third motif having Dx(3-4)D or Dx(3-4)E n=1 Tax=Actinacidiphila yanglinensis TaxID=310779 RepID=A0A1H6EF63_9ACTN|nr:HAD family hydrolase [Actinacidiphila yanglinensis]SEG95649.1 haloacid dehalogenase superfamily, subfamily IA, variant 3 with third motif having DD or ED/haloacid dehalogenase superfamily, subfamily IA, variant 1 with third motif having Dx(3-4)D or Dx(3-4)E [Actinacidiphila yanglinensis]